MNYNFEFIIPRNREDLLVSLTPDQYSVSEVYPVDEVPSKINECKMSLKELGCNFILEDFGSLYSVLVNFKTLSFENLQYCYNEVIVDELKAINNTLCLLFEDDDINSETRIKMLNVTKMSIYIAVEFLKLFREKVDHTYNLVINKRGQKNTKLVKLREEHNWDWEENERTALEIILRIVKQPLYRLWDPPTPEEEFIRLIEDCCYSVLEKPSVTSAKMKPSRDILYETLAVLITQYNDTISCKVKIVQMLKIYEHLVSVLAQAVLLFVQKYNCRSLVREVILEIIESNSEMDKYSQDQSSFRVFSNFIVEIATQEPELVLPCVNILTPNLNSDPYSMRICVLTVMAEIVANVLHSDDEEALAEDRRNTRDAFLEHLLDHIEDVHGFVRSKVLKLWLNIFKKNAVPKHFLIIILARTIQRLNDKSSNVVKNAIRLITVMLQNNPFGALLNEDSVKDNLRILKFTLIESESALEKPCLFKLWFYLRSEFSEFISKTLKGEVQESDNSQVPESDPEEEIVEDEYKQKNELMNYLVEIRKRVLKIDFEYLFLILRKFESTYLKCSKFLSQIDDLVLYYQWILGNICKENENILLITALSTCTNSSELKYLINQTIYDTEQMEAELGPDRAVFTYCEDYRRFVETVRTAINVIGELMMAGSSVETLEAIEFFKTAYAFSLSGADEVLVKMLLLINSKEAGVREAVVRAYKSIYLNWENVDSYDEAAATVEKLTLLLQKISYEQEKALNELIKQWVVDEDIGDTFVQVLWDKYSRKCSNSTIEDSQAAILLLTMCASGKPEIIQNNLEKLAKHGLSRENYKNYFLVKYTCRCLHVIQGLKNEDGVLIKYPMNHEIVECLASVLVDHFNVLDNDLYPEIAVEAISTIYHLSANPDILCENILQSLLKKIQKSSIIENEEKFINDELYIRFVVVIGHIAFSHWQFLEHDVYVELKRRNAESKSRKSIEKRNEIRSSISNEKKNDATMTYNFEDDALAMADERITESIRAVCEHELFLENNVFSLFSKVIITLCQNPDKIRNERLQSAASIALSKLMMISSVFCGENIQLFITILEKTTIPDVKINLIIAFGDLTFRFPNTVEPWTIYFYNRLKDESRSVRYTALLVVAHLITNEMIKVRGQMSDVALCLVDKDVSIKNCANSLFHELSVKGNSLYNVMPDIISRLSHPDYRTTEENFKVILKTLMKLITKDRHLESIVEKLCHRFGGTADERQCIDLSYCLTLITYTERSVQKLIDNLISYAEKLNCARVHKNFTNIIITCKKQAKVGKLADLVQELENKIDIILTKGVDNLEATFLKPTKTPAKGNKTPRTNKSIMESTRKSTRMSTKKKPRRLVMTSSSEESDADA